MKFKFSSCRHECRAMEKINACLFLSNRDKKIMLTKIYNTLVDLLERVCADKKNNQYSFSKTWTADIKMLIDHLREFKIIINNLK